jgi:hypothetical protein
LRRQQAAEDVIASRALAACGWTVPPAAERPPATATAASINVDNLLKQGADTEAVLVGLAKVGEPLTAVTVHVPDEIVARLVNQVIGDTIPRSVITNAIKSVSAKHFGCGLYYVAKEMVAALQVAGVTFENAAKIERAIVGWQLVMFSRLPAARETAASAAAAEGEAVIDRVFKSVLGDKI